MNRTLVICKPDAVERGYVGEIIGRLESKGLKIVAAEMRTLSADTLAEHYSEHLDKPFYKDLVDFMTRGPVVLAVVEGPETVASIVRHLMGPTDPATAPPGTIRGDLATVMTENLIHGSDSPESAEREIKIFFPDLA